MVVVSITAIVTLAKMRPTRFKPLLSTIVVALYAAPQWLFS
jgi:hypothetical protein